MDQKKAARPIIPKQKRILINFLKCNPNLLSGKFSKDFTTKTARKLWLEAKTLLNSIPNGANKDWYQWRKTWQDLKKNAKSKSIAYKKHAYGKGDLLALGIKPLTDEENEILELINSTVTEVLPNSFDTFYYEDPQEESTDNVGEVVENFEEEQEEQEEDHNYYNLIPLKSSQIREIKSLITSKSKKVNKSSGLKNSLQISQDILHLINERSNIKEKYYEEKIKFLQNRTEYQNTKIKLLKEANEKRLENIHLLEEISNSLKQNLNRI